MEDNKTMTIQKQLREFKKREKSAGKKIKLKRLFFCFLAAAMMICTVSGLSVPSFAEEADSPEIISYKATQSAITLEWTKVKDADAYDIEIYDYAASKDCVKQKRVSSKSTSATIKGLEYGVKYTCYVYALEEQDGEYFTLGTRSARKVVRTEPKDEKKSSDQSGSTAKNDEKKTLHKDGWAAENGETYYYQNGEAVKSKTVLIDGKIYLFGKTGKLLKGGLYTVKNYKYYTDENGAVTTNQWLTMTTPHTYYYAESTGRLTLYEFKNEGVYFNYLYIGGKKATENDLPAGDGFYKISDGYYDLSATSSSVWVSLPYIFKSENVYDIRTGKITECFADNGLETKDRLIVGGSAFDLNSGIKYDFNENSRVMKKTKYDSPLLITDVSVKINSVGGAEPTIKIINNSDKTIKYIDYTVRFKNNVGDYVSSEIGRKSTFYLRVTGPIEGHTADSGYWDPVIYNYHANNLVFSSITIEYMDGTKTTLSGNQIVLI